MSFPIPGTLMVEPTESESKAELDRFCDAMIAIREEIARDRGGQVAARGQPAQERAAHGGRAAGRPSGPHPYSRETRRVPAALRRATASSGPPVGRLNNALGDRKLSAPAPTSANTRSDRRTLTPTLSRKREREPINQLNRSNPLPRGAGRVRVRVLPEVARDTARDPVPADRRSMLRAGGNPPACGCPCRTQRRRCGDVRSWRLARVRGLAADRRVIDRHDRPPAVLIAGVPHIRQSRTSVGFSARRASRWPWQAGIPRRPARRLRSHRAGPAPGRGAYTPS